MKDIEKLEEQYNKEIRLAEQHKNRAKTIADEIKFLKGEECNSRISRLNLTPDQFKKLLKLLDNKENLLDAVELLEPSPSMDNKEDIEEEGEVVE